MFEHWRIHSPETSERTAGAHPRGNTGRHRQEISFDRGKKDGMFGFNGKADDFVHWRRRIASYLSEEDVIYGQLIDSARQQPGAITEEVADKNASGIATKLRLNVKELRRKL